MVNTPHKQQQKRLRYKIRGRKKKDTKDRSGEKVVVVEMEVVEGLLRRQTTPESEGQRAAVRER